MSGPSRAAQTPIASRSTLIDYVASGCKPLKDWRIGTEHEKFCFDRRDQSPLPYEGARGIGQVLHELSRFPWQPIEEDGHLIALHREGGATVTLEPGGQLELSGATLETLHETCCEAACHLAEAKAVGETLDVGFLGMGFAPTWQRDEVPWMPKGRYAIMQRYMPTRGALGLDMMKRTSTVQVNLDFSSEADMITKFRVALALQPVATALFADSPFTNGAPNGYQSYRSHIWTDTDPDRTGLLDFVFDEGFGFERYVDYALSVPMYFVHRDGRYLDVAGSSFPDYLAGRLGGRLEATRGIEPRLSDFDDHLTTLFPEVRLKRFLEMRGADSGPWNRICALPAYWVGLLYDATALDAAWQLVSDFSRDERHALRDGVPKSGLDLPFRKGKVLDLARASLAISAAGLARRAKLDPAGADERVHLEPLVEIVEAGQSPASRKLELFHGPWQGRLEPLFDAYAY